MLYYNTNPQDFHKMAELGYTLVPIKGIGAKYPPMKGWNKPGFKCDIKKHIQDNPGTNMGVAADTITIIDIDDLDGKWWLKHEGELLAGNPMQVNTRKGLHLYFKATDISNKLSGASRKEFPDGDIRNANKYYGIAPGSCVGTHLYTIKEAVPIHALPEFPDRLFPNNQPHRPNTCLLYTSDAADE